MKIYAAVFIYERPVVLRNNLESIFENRLQPDRIDLIDDCSPSSEVSALVDKWCLSEPNAFPLKKAANAGASDSGRISLEWARSLNPDYFFPLEADYIFKPWAFETVVDVFENTKEGKFALGICGYDHPFFYFEQMHETFRKCMIQQVGEDNVNRDALHKPFWRGRYVLEFVSNTCPTSYWNWKLLREIASEFPDMNRMLDEVFDPQPNPNYPPSAEYGAKNIIDDGMLSHCFSLFWNRWAIKHGIDRNRNAAWLNIKPSIAQAITGGGQHSKVGEMETDGGSPSWTE